MLDLVIWINIKGLKQSAIPPISIERTILNWTYWTQKDHNIWCRKSTPPPWVRYKSGELPVTHTIFMCARGIECASFEDFPVGWWNCSDGMTFFLAWNLTEKITECIDGIINVFFNRKRRYFNNLIRWFGLVSAISWRSLLMMDEPGVPGENHGPVASHWQTFSHYVVSLKWHSNSQR